ncbi:hypothetical protein CXF68_16300 [Tenacibaculum sp. Bg11-29]|uniref:LytR/AlgR family response regulator transcription factor n=1 Tax=Tenacibaculum sp. Bg11-29 TaxID=2058306 RepID=UPI000C3208EE|nr:response regulator [Tenacibaculum sp. Bg11-29]PKH52155.1 hypothetical protein CXF68_16300 [Tenacibaculum sp. Bg11-29]
MIRYILVDDNPKILEKVKAKISTIANDYELDHIASFSSSKKAFEEVNEAGYDLLIVDFDMPVYNGIELAQKIATNKKIIFLTSTTNNEKLIINNLDISGYLSKPFEIDEFKCILKNKIIGKIKPKINTRKNISLEKGSSNYVFNPEDAFYITTAKIGNEQSKKNYVSIYGKNDTVLIANIRFTITELSEKLRGYNFQKISKSTLVNLNHVKSTIGKEIKFHHSKQIFEMTDNEKPNFKTRLKLLFGV